jgi:hypothetical protein
MVAVTADLIRTVTPGHAEGGVWQDAETENLGPRVTGVLASFKLDSPS